MERGCFSTAGQGTKGNIYAEPDFGVYAMFFLKIK